MTLSEEVYLKLRDDVNTLVFGANEFLNEQQLADRYHASKAPVRSALHRLCMEGVLISYPRKGYVIRTLDDTEFRQVQELRIVNESYALELIYQTASPEQLLELLQIARQGSSIRDNMAFHLALGRCSGNQFLVDVIDRLLCAVTRTMTMYTFGGSKNRFQESHTAIVNALIERDLERAQICLCEDIKR